MADLPKGNIPEKPALRLAGTPAGGADLERVAVPADLRKRLAEGYTIRHAHGHEFECGGEKKSVLVLILTRD